MIIKRRAGDLPDWSLVYPVHASHPGIPSTLCVLRRQEDPLFLYLAHPSAPTVAIALAVPDDTVMAVVPDCPQTHRAPTEVWEAVANLSSGGFTVEVLDQ